VKSHYSNNVVICVLLQTSVD